MSLVNGWIVPEGEEHFDVLRGRRASVDHYFAAPHRMLIVRLDDLRQTKEPLFLLCTGITRLEMAPAWSIDDLRCSSVDASTIVLDDKQAGFHVACHALRLFSVEEFKQWLGKDQYLLDPSANTLQVILQA
ncbi:MAG TPA: hypothetical protein PK867_04395, partial [Pirellulales bacterium]|nr:hypothetical protein [Pirellulales bacterium]